MFYTRTRIASAILCACVIFSLIFTPALAKEDAQDQKTAIAAEITEVYGGRNGIISMTFDDGYYETALLLNELFEEYDLYGTIMMLTTSTEDRSTIGATAEEWNALFADGRLDVQSHSSNHYNLSSTGKPEYQNEETFKSEILDSREVLSGKFPDYDIIAFAMPYGRMTDAALEYAQKHYYAIRSVSNGVQSLSPKSSTESGGWYKMYSPSVKHSQSENNPDEQLAVEKTGVTTDTPNNGDNSPSAPTTTPTPIPLPLIIGICAGGVIVLGGAAFVAIMMLKKRTR